MNTGRIVLYGAAGIVAMSTVAASSCQTTSPSIQQSATAQQSSSNATPTPTAAAPSAQSLGAEVTTTNGLKITAIKWQHVQSNNQFNTPAPGGYFSAADVKVCAGSSTFHADPQQWSLVNADASQIQASTEFDAALVDLPGPAFKTTDIPAGGCLSGWVEFAVPPNTTPTEIQPSGANYYWTLS